MKDTAFLHRKNTGSRPTALSKGKRAHEIFFAECTA
jgi:hypothetical protein